MENLEKRFELEQEEKIYQFWEKNGYFLPNKDSKKEPFTIIMPPPNANGSLHIGHAVFITLEDIMTRYNRMLGKPTLWLPGFDHAGFETQVVYEKKLEKEGKSRFQMPREKLYREIYEFTIANKDFAKSQLKHLGVSADWTREKFTLEPDIVSGTQDTFIQMFKDGLVYRGNRLVNWCIKHQTGLSDVETKTESRKDPLYYIKYGPITLATVRPETKFGDTAIAVHPKDKRYKDYIGKDLDVETIIGKRKIRVVADEAVDPDFGTGAVKITPAHDQTDFDIWQRHKDEISGPIEVIDKFGRLDLLKHFPNNEKVKKYHGLKIAEARKIMAEDMQSMGLVEKIDDTYEHNVTTCYKCGSILEPRLMPQWYIAIKSLAEPAIKAVENGEIEVLPGRYKKVYLHWMKNIRDWNISRQIVWGIQIPAWFCEGCNEAMVQKEDPKICKKCGSKKIHQDPDVFDTWFSSGQWPYLALGYPNSKDYKLFYPTSVMETGWDILFFWVARMIMFGFYRTGRAPFHTVYLHGLVRDKDRQKMSKSKGNVIDPLGVAKDYGSDAVRMALVFGTGIGNDIVISEEKIRGFRNFTTKVWNASRFVIQNLEGLDKKISIEKKELSKEDKWIFEELNKVQNEVTRALESYHFHSAAEKIYDFFWHKFADKTIEDTKQRIYGDDPQKKQIAQAVLYKVLTDSLKLLHPFIPFVTEAIWQNLDQEKPLIITEWSSKL